MRDLIWVRQNAVAMCALLWLVGCASSDSTGDSAADASAGGGVVGGAGGGLPPIADASVGGNSGAGGAGGAGGDSAPLGRFKEPCNDNLDCASGWCVPWEDRTVCSQACLDEGCPDDWGCRAVQNTEPDVVFICFPPGDRLCKACLNDGDCPTGRCLTVDEQNVCGLDCLDDEACPEGYACEDVFGDGRPNQCVPTTGSCTCGPDTAGEQRLCEVGNDLGVCYGRQTCDPASGWSACDAAPPAPEVCNLIDDDCNGLTDDIPGIGEVCARTVETDDGDIECTGRLVCTQASEEPVCTAPAPMEELCNFLDDDCDGATDEGFDDLGQVCLVGEGACRQAGVQVCSEDGAEVICDAVLGMPTDELCNGLDDDCDGNTDEGFDGLGEICSAGVGACQRPGATRCSDDGASVECSAVAAEPGAELCNGLDDDCDGSADETFDGLLDPCTAGVGACLRQGFQACSEDGASVACSAVAGEASDELCNGLDDDCDGTADENFPGLNAACAIGVGQCRVSGVTLCGPAGDGVVCSAVAGQPVEEVCNGLDDDCDGITDETFPTLGQVCEAGVGSCLRNGVLTCNAEGDDVACNAVAGEPADEVCNGADDDCDGTPDEGYDGLSEVCSVGVGTCLRTSVQICNAEGDGVTCDAEPGAPGDVDRCDGLDDDCDGSTDEAFPDKLQVCQVGQGLCQRTGFRVCTEAGDATECNVEPGAPQAENCNGLDDDCDGNTDEGFVGLNTTCSVGVGQCLSRGVRICSPAGDAVICDAVAGQPADELCNGLDDDCDGGTDETFEGLLEPCTAGVGVCLRQGFQACNEDGDGVVCSAEAGEPADEACNGLDDDCDGEADETFPGLNTACAAGVGQCRATGVTLCGPDGDGVVCSAEPGLPAGEVCNGLDDDCDGTTDEAFPTLGQVCNEGVGACSRNGVLGCNAGGDGVACNAVAGQPVEELCNGLDDDCDGNTDEGFVGLNTTCSVGVGQCLSRGVRICSPAGDAVICDALAGAPIEELCNGLDDDCDGVFDETFPDLNTPCSAGLGVCQRGGVQRCLPDGSATVCSAEAGQGGAETCNGLDDDCDGTADEDYPGLNTACEVGQGLCRRSGVQVCNPDNPAGALICDAEIVSGADDELCDFQDDDCDGQTDEDYTDDQGRYVTLSHCGACGTDCVAQWSPNPETFGVVPRCDASGGAAQCAFDCINGFLDADGRASNGCELEIDDDAIYVATPENGGVEAADCGAVLRPCARINLGIEQAVASNRSRVRVSDGVYRETVIMQTGVSVLGGHQRTTWIRDAELNVTFINGRDTEPGAHKAAVRAVGITGIDTVLDGFVINGESPLESGNSYGIYVLDSDSALQISNNRIFAGDGGRGVAGDSGDAGLPGVDGSDGNEATPDIEQCVATGGNLFSPGGLGGSRTCGQTPVNGGGGGVSVCPAFDVQAGSGLAGLSAQGSAGGLGGWNMVSLDDNTCTVSEFGTPDPFPGLDGGSGVDGGGGNGAAEGFGLTQNGHWVGVTGNGGVDGQPGGGGGGGGAAGGVEVLWLLPQQVYDFGATGGGGGSGGCQGIAGLGGGGGGGSFAIFVAFSGAGPGNVAGFPLITDNLLNRGLGGQGGSGGNGGGGGEGGAGGDGGPAGPVLFMPFCSFAGAPGGTGGRGGHGGGGGGGQGGASFDVFVANGNGLAPDYAAQNDFGLAGDISTGGPGGDGGNSSNTLVGLGGEGAEGPSGQVANQ
ncbi:MAG: MopE-related protein [Bradymonadia bacterium]